MRVLFGYSTFSCQMNTEAVPILSQDPIPTLILMFVYAVPPVLYI